MSYVVIHGRVSFNIHLVRNARSFFRGNIVVLFMYSDCTNYVDPHTIIIIFLRFWLYFMYFLYFLTDGFGFSVFDSRS
jgi:hypothetical protein